MRQVIRELLRRFRRTSQPVMLIPVDLDCQAIIDHVEATNKWARSSYEGPWEMQTESCIYDVALDNAVFQAIQQALSVYHHYHPGMQVSRDEQYKVMKYVAGQEFPIHVDQNAMELQYTRSVSVVIYLNEEFEGGHTVFPNEGLDFKPKKSHALVFPASYAFPHGSTPITKGVKYALVTWLHMGPPWLTDAP